MTWQTFYSSASRSGTKGGTEPQVLFLVKIVKKGLCCVFGVCVGGVTMRCNS